MTSTTEFRADSVISHVFGDPSLMDRLTHLSHSAMPAGRYSVTWATMLQLYREGQTPDLVTVADRLSRSDMAVEMLGDGWAHWLMGLCSGQYFSHDVVADAKALIERHQAMQLKLRLEQLLRDEHSTNADFLAAMDELRAEMPETGSELSAMTAAELDAGEFPLNYLISGILVEAQPCIVAAPKKSLKTNIMIDATLSLASGAKFLGEFYVPEPKRVALISGESGQATIQETARRIAASKADIGRTMEKVLNALQGHPDGITARRFKEDHGIKPMLLQAAIGRLIESGNVEACEIVASNKQSYSGWRLCEHSAGTTGNHREQFPLIPGVATETPVGAGTVSL